MLVSTIMPEFLHGRNDHSHTGMISHTLKKKEIKQGNSLSCKILILHNLYLVPTFIFSHHYNAI